MGAVFGLGDVVPALAVAGEEEDFDAFSFLGGGGEGANITFKAWPDFRVL